MKSKKLLAALLCVVMLISSWPAFVMADGDEGDPGTGAESGTTVLDALEEGEYYLSGDVPYHGTLSVTFTPETSGKYSFLADNASDASITVTDEYGTALPIIDSDYEGWSAVVILQLEAGKTYTFNVTATSFCCYKACTLLIIKTPEQAKTGMNTFMVQSEHDIKIPFTPSETGAYVFSASADLLVDSSAPDLYLSVLEGYVQVSKYISSGSRINYMAFLKAGETYTLDISCYDESSSFYCVANVNITQDIPALVENSANNITRGSDNDIPLYSFTATTDGVYVFSSEGEYDTAVAIYDSYGHNRDEDYYGEDQNFCLGVPMRAGEKYYMSFRTWASGEITFPVRVVKADTIQSGNHVLDANPNQIEYRAFTPAVSGCYLVESNTNGTVKIGSYLDSSFSQGNIKVFYLEKDQLYALGCVNSSSEEEFTFKVNLIDQSLTSGTSTTLIRKANNHIYALFTPTETGTYSYTITMPEGKYYNYAGLYYASTGYSATQTAYDGYAHTYSYYVKAGETYVFDLSVEYYDNPAEEVTVSVAKEALPTLIVGKNEGLFTGSDKNYTFTPAKTGIYAFYNYTSTSMPLYLGSSSISYYLQQSDYDVDYYLYAFALEKGQEYRLSVDSYTTGPKDVYIAEVPAFKNGENEIEKYGNYVCASFTPDTSGPYYFTCEDCSISEICEATDNGLEYFTKTTINGKTCAIFEANKTYVFAIHARSTHASDSYKVTIEPERVLKMGKNEDVFVEMKVDSNTRFTYYTFVPTQSGTYTFSSESQDDIALYGIMYKNDELQSELGRGYYDSFTGKMKMTVTLEAGVLYRLGLYSNQDVQNLNVDLFVEIAPAGSLGGYSLSLDGSIAVNLYLSLADYVVESETAVLRCTFPGNTIVDYKISDATTKTVNNQEYYVFHLPVAAKQMRDSIYAKIVDETNGVESEQFDVSVMQYARAIRTYAYDMYGNIANQEFYDAIPMVKALLNYGSRAQTYFNYNPYHLANEVLDYADRSLASVQYQSIPKFDATDENEVKLPAGLTFYGASLTVESETSLVFYFINDTGASVSFSEENCGMTNYKGKKSDGYTIVCVPGIPAHKLGEKVHLKITVPGDDTEYYINYSPLNYCYNVLSRSTTATRTEALKDLLRAFYIYNQAAVTYVNNKHN